MEIAFMSSIADETRFCASTLPTRLKQIRASRIGCASRRPIFACRRISFSRVPAVHSGSPLVFSQNRFASSPGANRLPVPAAPRVFTRASKAMGAGLMKRSSRRDLRVPPPAQPTTQTCAPLNRSRSVCAGLSKQPRRQAKEFGGTRSDCPCPRLPFRVST